VATAATVGLLSAGVANAEVPVPEVMVSADFDSLPSGPIAPQDFISELGGRNTSWAAYDDTSIVAVSGRGKVIRTKFDAGTIHSIPAGNNGATFFIRLSRVLHQACMSYDIRFDANFDWSMGGKLPGLEGVAPDVRPSFPTGGNFVGDKGWSGRMMWVGPEAYSWAGATNQAVSYMYNPEQASQYGDNVRWNESFVAGQWHNVKQCFTMNTVGRADGRLHAWMDGVEVVADNAFVFRTRSDVGISHVVWHLFRGGAKLVWAGSRTGYVDIDNVLVTTTS
jgi:hypothetical protein